MADIRFISTFIRQAKSGDLACGFRHLFVLDDTTPYPTMFYLSTMSVCLIEPDDYKCARDAELCPYWARTTLKLLDENTPDNPSADLRDAIIRVRAYAQKCATAGEEPKPRVRKRVRTRVRQRVRRRVRSS